MIVAGDLEAVCGFAAGLDRDSGRRLANVLASCGLETVLIADRAESSVKGVPIIVKNKWPRKASSTLALTTQLIVVFSTTFNGNKDTELQD